MKMTLCAFIISPVYNSNWVDAGWCWFVWRSCMHIDITPYTLILLIFSYDGCAFIFSDFNDDIYFPVAVYYRNVKHYYTYLCLVACHRFHLMLGGLLLPTSITYFSRYHYTPYALATPILTAQSRQHYSYDSLTTICRWLRYNIFSALAMEILQFRTKPSIWSVMATVIWFQLKGMV